MADSTIGASRQGVIVVVDLGDIRVVVLVSTSIALTAEKLLQLHQTIASNFAEAHPQAPTILLL